MGEVADIAKLARCTINQMEVGLGARLWSDEHTGRAR